MYVQRLLSCTTHNGGGDDSANNLTTLKIQMPERVTERNKQPNSLTDKEVREPLGAY